MKSQIAYCSACDRDVHVVWTDDVLHDAQAPIPDAEVVCLEIGSKCTGAMCPIGAQPPSVMKARLVRSGLKPVVQPLITAMCAACQQVTGFAIIDATFATCTECGHTERRDVLTVPTSN